MTETTGQIFKRLLRDLLNGNRKFMQSCVWSLTAMWGYCLHESFVFMLSPEMFALVKVAPLSATVGMGIPTSLSAVLGGIWFKTLSLYSNNGIALDAQASGQPREFAVSGTLREERTPTKGFPGA